MERELEKEYMDMNDRLTALEKSNRELLNSTKNLTGILTDYIKIIQELSMKNEILGLRLMNMPYELMDEKSKKIYWLPKIMTIEETIDKIVNERKSISRFGDGEFGIIYDIQYWKFQKRDKKLSERLKEVLISDEENLLIGLNDFYGDLSHRRPEERDAIRSFITPVVREQHYRYLSKERVYANARVSRNWTKEMAENQKRIWAEKDCVFIEGDKTRMGVGNDLFENTSSIQRILCPSESAFDRYDEILTEALKLPKNLLILIALGPTASVLAYDLAIRGYQAIDLGHADLSYEWLKRNGGKKTAVTYKYNNEYPGGDCVEEIHDKKYEEQIIADLSK